MRTWTLALSILLILFGVRYFSHDATPTQEPESDTTNIETSQSEKTSSRLKASGNALVKIPEAPLSQESGLVLNVPALKEAPTGKAALDERARANLNQSEVKADKRLKSIQSAISDYDEEAFEEKSLADQTLLEDFREGKNPPPPRWNEEEDEDVNAELGSSSVAPKLKSWENPDLDADDEGNLDDAETPPSYAR